jgi:TPP-dependent pyruvate/acetoin dehydrogenase alpha subunit
MHDKLYRALYRIRRVEEQVAAVYPTDKIKSPVHLSIGQESISVGVCEALRPDDVVFGTYRSHALYLAKGGDLKAMIAELYGKATGCAKGKGGSMHLIAPSVHMWGTSAVVGTTIPHAIGYAYALKLRGSDSIVACFFGDGATEEGVYYESLNFAALKQLPVLFVCENNSYAIHTHVLRRQLSANLCERARTYGLTAQHIDDGDVLRIYETTREMAQALRTGQSGPFFLECATYRWKEHVGPGDDFHLGYRSREDFEPWKQNDQVPRMAALVDPVQRRQIEQQVETEIAEAFAFAEASSFPAPAELFTDVFKES